MSSRAAVFLDRDGVINRNVLDPTTGEYGAPLTADRLELAPGAIDGMLELHRADLPLFLISNQPNYAKGKSTLEELAAIHRRLLGLLGASGISLAEAYYCYHHPRGVVAGYSGPCECRKPSPYFVHKASAEHGVSLEASWMVGDRATDIECGRAAGLRTIRVADDHPSQRKRDDIEADFEADFEAEDLSEAARIIRKNSPPE